MKQARKFSQKNKERTSLVTAMTRSGPCCLVIDKFIFHFNIEMVLRCTLRSHIVDHKYTIFWFVFYQKWKKWKIGLKIGPSAHCRVLLRTTTSDFDSWDSEDAKNGLKHLDWTPDTRDTKCVLKWVLVRIAAFCCAHRPQIWIPEIL